MIWQTNVFPKAKADFAHRHAGGLHKVLLLRKFVWEGAS